MMIHDETCPKCGAVYNPINGPHTCAVAPLPIEVQIINQAIAEAIELAPKAPWVGPAPIEVAPEPEPVKKGKRNAQK